MQMLSSIHPLAEPFYFHNKQTLTNKTSFYYKTQIRVLALSHNKHLLI
ncbi:hypothetical protein VCRA2119O430_20050 [Vibrio crassostreae]|nr:hypothetical protein VCRA2118O429_10051 [Vibrio crassostreae]CAK1969660.1 hypothetical protein VCRA2117O428_20050 [Vibrio crassostreae]CAK1971563.1 hypothetical protein VCRA2119O430_20050 [Vibrio crassostreae]CAK2001995.1 hypothetical protein VCRA2114O422_20377 [Vibrio crassostreae]CAK2008691.1 hypothetical protein VCRA2119O431_20378 [Vibrio crassostreae]